ncbi:MAG: UDP-N-acetylmuramoyl-tripeptide--D-alanyl-D-alanine ligase [Smithella sp.]
MVAKDGGKDSMMTHWNVSDFAALAGGVVLGRDASMPIRILSDSRDVFPGDAFIALPGTKQDGHLFLEDAVKMGANILIGSNENMLRKFANDQACVFIKDIETTIIETARKYIKIVNPKIIAVTGSVGKTTTRECIYRVLNNKYKVHRPFRSYNTNIGCALTILSMSPDTNFLVLEMGANHENEIASMVSVFPPDVAVITEAAAAHLEGFKNIDAIVSTKSEIYKNINTKVLFYNSDRIELSNKIVKDTTNIEKYGVGLKHSYYKIASPEFSMYKNRPKLTFILRTNRDEYFVESQFVGVHNVYPIAFALSIGEYFNVVKKEMLESISHMEPLDGRGVHIQLDNGATLLDDSYNANPLSMIAALNALKNITTNGKKIAILGDMKELGVDSILFHKDLLKEATFCDVVILYGDIWNKALKESNNSNYSFELIPCDSLEQCYFNIIKYMKSCNVFLIKGSHSNNLDFLVSKIKKEYYL